MRQIRPHLSGPRSANVAVIGGGLLGVSTALHLAEKGFSVVLLEAVRIGFGASGRNGGQMLAGMARGFDDLDHAMGIVDARCLYRMTLDGVALARALIARHEIDCDYHIGAITAAARAGHVPGLAREMEMLTRAGHEGLRLLNADETRAALGTTRFFGGLSDPLGGHVHPLNLTLGLAKAAEAAGASLHEDSEVVAIEGEGPLRVVTRQGMVTAEHVVLAGNAYLGDLVPSIRPKIMTATTFMIATEAIAPERLARLLPDNPCVADTNFILDYYRRSSDHRLLWGGGVSYRARDSVKLSHRLIDRLHMTYPDLRDIGIADAWNGLIDISMNRLPHVGRIGSRILFAQGFSGHGVILAILIGRVMCDVIVGTQKSFDLLARIPHRNFPGGNLLRRPMLIAATLYARLINILGG